MLSEYALREGVLLDTLERSRGGILHHLQDVSRRGVEHLATSLDEDPGHSAHVAHLALQLFDATTEVHGLGADAREYLEAAALLANVGLSISHSKHHKHSYYVIRNSDRLVGPHRPRDRADRPDRPLPPQERAEARAPRVGGARSTTTRSSCGRAPRCCGSPSASTAATRAASARSAPRCGPTGWWSLAVPAGDDDAELERYAAGERTGLLEEVAGRPVEVQIAPV